MNIIELLNSKSSNSGSMVLYLNKRPELIEEIDKLLSNSLDNSFDDLNLLQKVWHIINNDWKKRICSCGKLNTWLGIKHGWRISCGNKECYIPMVKKNNIEKYGVDNPAKLDIIKNKKKENCIVKHGVESHTQLQSTKDKAKQNNLVKYGVEHTSMLKENRKKAVDTYNSDPNKRVEKINKFKNTYYSKTEEDKKNIQNKKEDSLYEKYGVKHTFKSSIIKDKIKKTIIERYGVDHQFKSESIVNKRIESYKKQYVEKLKNMIPSHISYISHTYTSTEKDIEFTLHCNNCNKDFRILYTLFYNRNKASLDLCTNCFSQLHKSNGEQELKKYIESIYSGLVVNNTTSIIKPKHIDMFLPEVNIAFEFNGIYWHNELFKDSRYHINKTDSCVGKNIKLVHIWEDDWIYKQDILKSRISNLLGKNTTIGARKCEIKEISTKECRVFFDDNHLQGFIGSKYYVGLFYDNELVSAMSFGSLRSALGSKHSDSIYELYRFCNKKYINVVGGASKLLKYFIRRYTPTQIISYFDRNWGYSSVYKKLGFKLIGNTEPNYWYVINDIKTHRYNYTKAKLVKAGNDDTKTEKDIMFENKHYRVYDSGNEKWVWNKSYFL
jgi:hypothetical protein